MFRGTLGTPFGSVGCIVQAWISKSSTAVFARDIFFWRIDAAGFVYISSNVITWPVVLLFLKQQIFTMCHGRLGSHFELHYVMAGVRMHGQCSAVKAWTFAVGIDFSVCLKKNMEYSVSNYEDFIPEGYKFLFLAYFYIILIWDVYAKNKSNTNH